MKLLIMNWFFVFIFYNFFYSIFSILLLIFRPLAFSSNKLCSFSLQLTWSGFCIKCILVSNSPSLFSKSIISCLDLWANLLKKIKSCGLSNFEILGCSRGQIYHFSSLLHMAMDQLFYVSTKMDFSKTEMKNIDDPLIFVQWFYHFCNLIFCLYRLGSDTFCLYRDRVHVTFY